MADIKIGTINDVSTQLIDLQFSTLCRLYKNYFGDKPVHGMPKYLHELLPRSDGWCFCPEWPMPRRIERWQGDNLRDVHKPVREKKTSYGVEDLLSVEGQIYPKGKTHLCRHYSIRIISKALEEYQPAFQHINGDEEIKTWISILNDNPLTVKESDTQNTFDDLNILRMQFLKRWLKTERIRVANIQRKKRDYVNSAEVERLILPENIEFVSKFYSDGSEKEARKNLGKWYVFTLYYLGANWRDLIRMRRKNARFIRRDPYTLRPMHGPEAWGSLALLRLRRHTKHKEVKKRSVYLK